MLRNCLMSLVCNVTRSVWDVTYLSDVRRLSDQAYVSKDVWRLSDQSNVSKMLSLRLWNVDGWWRCRERLC